MLKAILVLLAAVAVAVQGYPYQSNELGEAARSGNWDEFRRLLTQNLAQHFPVQFPEDIKTLRSDPGTQVYGQSVATYKSSSNINGQHSEFSAGHKVTNDNGDIVEYDFKP